MHVEKCINQSLVNIREHYSLTISHKLRMSYVVKITCL